MNWENKTPKPSDIIRTKVKFYYHYGIFISEDEVIQFGLPDDPGRPAEKIKVISTDIYTFLMGGEIEVAKPDSEERKKMRNTADIIKTARDKIGEGGYDILHNNCEHFVNNCVFGESNSSFVDSVREKIRAKLKKNKN